MERANRLQKATEVKAIIDSSDLVTSWRMACRRVDTDAMTALYVSDRKGKSVAVITIDADGSVKGTWFPGHSMSRDRLRAALNIR